MNFSFFLEMAWKSALIAGGALLLVALLKSRAPADRADLLRLAVGLLLLLPFVSLLLPALQVEMAANPEAAQTIDLATLAALQAQAAAYSAPAAEAKGFWVDPAALLAMLYTGGVLIFGIRLTAGLLTLRRWTAAASDLADRRWAHSFERIRDEAGAPEKLRLLVSDEAPSPLSWGYFRPVILIDRESMDRDEDVEAILAHETAHVVRGDWLTLMLARLAVVLFWFNPLVWILERTMVQQAEEAADSYALDDVEPARYAQTLLNCMQHARGAALPANSIGASGLSRRVKAVLEGRRTPTGSVWSLSAMVATIAFAAPVAALELTEAAREGAPAPLAPLAPAASAMPAAKPVPVAAKAETVAAASVAAVAPVAEAAIVTATTAAPAPEPTPMAIVTFENSKAKPVRFAHVSASAIAQASDIDIDEREIALAVAEAQREAQREAAEAQREALREAAEAQREAQRETAHALRETKRARQQMAWNMAKGAADMERGAKEMERGAEHMRSEAKKLRSSRSYREKVIAEHAARGEHTTHEELIKAANGMEKGADGMLKGAEGMRRGAKQMRRQYSH
ncbi:MAG TPA: M56 family metallopeptidase [Allosphingosinicella sp.]|uniref:M56 family metallopeptidase n=1 Tax=Allosphingosinicella sp. TaxID=2823234 RepID=UPI002EDADF57